MEYAATVQTRKQGSTQDLSFGKFGNPVGYFRTKENPSGWAMYNLDEMDLFWFKGRNESINRVFRIVSDKGNTTLVKFTQKFGTVYFFDNLFYESTDCIAWIVKGVKIDALFFDNE